MGKITKYIIGGLVACGVLFIMWYFSNLVIYTLIAAVISIIGKPIVKFLDGIHLKKLRIPHSWSTAIALLVIIGSIVGLAAIFVPLILQQARIVAAIDVNVIGNDFHQRFNGLQNLLHNYGILGQREKLDSILISKAKEIISFSTVGDVLGSIVNFASNMIIGLFSVVFISFFFLKEDQLFSNIILLFVPQRYADKTLNVLDETKVLLSRYFSGICIQLLVMMTLEVTGLSIFKVPNALLIGCFGGLMNIIPYVGPLIGAIVGILLGLSSLISTGNYNDVVPMAITIVCVFSFANMVDNFVIQPFVFSNRVKAHPLEIFFVVLMAGSLAGVPGMVLAIPSYTVIRVIAKQFFVKFRVVQKLTQNL
jgi:predicted PurR-regulated permease PerM